MKRFINGRRKKILDCKYEDKRNIKKMTNKYCTLDDTNNRDCATQRYFPTIYLEHRPPNHHEDNLTIAKKPCKWQLVHIDSYTWPAKTKIKNGVLHRSKCSCFMLHIYTISKNLFHVNHRHINLYTMMRNN